MQEDRRVERDRLLRFPQVRDDPAEVHRSGSPELLPRALVRRERLIKLIEQPFQAAVTQVIAGPGYGKTALVADWAAQASRAVSWVRLVPADNTLTHLLPRLRAAVRELGGAAVAGERRDDLPQDAGTAEREALTQDIGAVHGPACLVLDDVHVLTDPPGIRLLNDLVASLPDSLHLVISGRTRPALRLGRLRVMGQVRDIGREDLRFTEREIAGVIPSDTKGHSHADLEDLVAQSEGWATGVFLAKLLLGEDSLPDAWDRRELHDAYLDEYVQQEILAPLEPGLQSFALSTAFLPFLSASLCDATLERSDSAELIADLRRELPFLAPSPGDRERYRLMPIIGQSLARLAASEPDPDRSKRKGRAARWLLRAGDLKTAGEFATRSGDAEVIGDISEAVCQEYAVRSDFDALGHCLGMLPADAFAGRPNLHYWRIASRLMVGRTFGTDTLMAEVIPGWLASDNPLLRGRALLSQGVMAYFRGDDVETTRLLTAALEHLPADACVENLHAVTFLGRSAFRQGRDELASTVLSRAIEFTAGLPLEEQWSWRTLGPDRGNAYALRGDIFSAITKYRLMLSELPPALASMEGFLRCRLVSLAIERHELEIATQEFERIEQLLGGEPAIWHHDAALARVRLLVALGQRDEAEAWGANYIKVLRRLPEKTQLVLMLARIWIERRELSLVRSWLDDIDAHEYPWVQVFGEINYRILAITLHLVEKDFEKTRELSSQLLAEAQATRRWSEVISVSMRLAVALHELGQVDEARSVARAAIERGVKGGFVRSFFVPQFDVAAMFADVWNESGEAARVRRRLQALQERSADVRAPELTRREIELLELVALGRSNQQIAADLFISVNTVRNHLVNICRRLNASSRLEAVSRARELGVLS